MFEIIDNCSLIIIDLKISIGIYLHPALRAYLNNFERMFYGLKYVLKITKNTEDYNLY